jgi:hypothetical protein
MPSSIKLFHFLPQIFVFDISKLTNDKCMNLTLKGILSTNFIYEIKDKKSSLYLTYSYKNYLKNKFNLLNIIIKGIIIKIIIYS